MKFPTGLSPPYPNHVCLLKKFIYGRKHASSQWYLKLTATLNSKGFSHPVSDYSFSFKKSTDSISIAVVYVDDILLTRDNPSELQ